MLGGQQEREGPPAQLKAAKTAAGVRPPGQGGAWKGPPPAWRTHVRFMSTEFLKGPPECGDKNGETVHRRITEALYFFQVF